MADGSHNGTGNFQSTEMTSGRLTHITTNAPPTVPLRRLLDEMHRASRTFSTSRAATMLKVVFVPLRLPGLAVHSIPPLVHAQSNMLTTPLLKSIVYRLHTVSRRWDESKRSLGHGPCHEQDNTTTVHSKQPPFLLWLLFAKEPGYTNFDLLDTRSPPALLHHTPFSWLAGERRDS